MSNADESAAGTSLEEPRTAEPLPGEGEDDPLILWFLTLTPTQRVEVAQDFIDSAKMLRDGLRS
jgi:hypothetical protein